jgi:hypothetical protein
LTLLGNRISAARSESCVRIAWSGLSGTQYSPTVSKTPLSYWTHTAITSTLQSTTTAHFAGGQVWAPAHGGTPARERQGGAAPVLQRRDLWRHNDNGHFELLKLMQARASSQAFTVLDSLTFKHASLLSAVARGDIARQVPLLASRLPADQVLEDSVRDVIDPRLHARALSDEERKKVCKTVYDKFCRETTFSPKSQFTFKVLD